MGIHPASEGPEVGRCDVAAPSALDVDLEASIRQLIHETGGETDVLALQQLKDFLQQPSSAVASAELLSRIAELLLVPHLTLTVSARFRPLLIDLCQRTILSSDGDERSLQVLHCLAVLVGIYPEIFDVAAHFTAAIEWERLCSHVLGHALLDLNQLLLDLFRLASASPWLLNPASGCSLNSSWIHSIVLSSSDRLPLATRLLALHLFALHQGISESLKLDLQNQCLLIATTEPSTSRSQDANAPLRYESEPVDAWLIEVIEFERIRRAAEVVSSRKLIFRPSSQQAPAETEVSAVVSRSIQVDDLAPGVCCVGGVLLVSSGTHSADGSGHLGEDSLDRFVETPGLDASLSDIALHLSARLPILLSGPPSSGKSSVVRHVANLVRGTPTATSGSHLLTIQLGDQSGVDAKQLLGSFVSSPTQPGKFVWSEGALTRAVRQGKWVVLEDIDKAASEVLSTVARLVEQLGPTKALGARPHIDLGNRGKVVAGTGFALFATRSIPASSAQGTRSAPNRPSFLGSSHWSEVAVDQPDQRDIEIILKSKFGRLADRHESFVSRLVQAWNRLRKATTPSASRDSNPQAQSGSLAGSIRTATLRDLIKWCQRVERLIASNDSLADPLANPLQQEEIFLEACDVFLGSVPPPSSSSISASDASIKSRAKMTSGQAADRFNALTELLAEQLGLSSERARWVLGERKPELAVRSGDATSASSRIQVGRCELVRRSRDVAKRAVPINRNFAMTKPSLLLLERLSVATALSEPILLVGETGTGKTTVVQHLASMLGQPMTALNLSQQTESGDLLGAFKPLDPRVPATELHDIWTSLFARTFSSRRNARFVDAERKTFVSGKWARLAALWHESAKMAFQRKRDDASASTTAATPSTEEHISANETDGRAESSSRKKRKTARGVMEGSPAALDDARAEADLDKEWQAFDQLARDFGIQHGAKKKNLVFSFVEGPLVKALRQGDWILLDEINLAAAETLDGLTGLLQSATSSVTLTERGDLEPVPRHPNFRLFACMNPATDVGKKDLPASLRSRFTELYVPSPDSDREALTSIVDKYIGEHCLGDRGAVMDVAECYAEIRQLAHHHELADGANQRPHFSIRTLSRALTFATDIAPQYGIRRGLWEGFIMAFSLLLDEESARRVRAIIERHILAKAKNARAIATFVPPAPKDADEGKWVQVGPFWLPTGPLPLDAAEDYILTPSVQTKLVGLSRAALTRRFPVLIQGPTSAGKTSAVEYLARRTGHRFVRINNHEHTDIQEYIGSYASDPDSGKLSFQEGLLVKALRRGDWIVLDELNLAPTDVLEALNRLLDDNRELVIPETGEVVRPHPHFMLFATQNPPGLYAGRKVLSRAFRNRFLELHFDDVPRPELETILTNRCKIAPSYSSRIVGVFEELQKRRQAAKVFETKHAFVTLRDLFRWGNREAVGYQQLAENGYMLIAERARRQDDKNTVKDVIEKIMKIRLDVDSMYALDGPAAQSALSRMGPALGAAIVEQLSHTTIVRTSAFERLLCLVATCLRYNEPVLLVGETGAGKTSVCEVLASAFHRQLHCVNCHQNTDTADLLGGQRPLRNRAAQQQAAKVNALELLATLGIATNVMPDSKVEDVAAQLEAVLAKWPSSLSQLTAEDSSSAKLKLEESLRALNHSTALFEWQDGPLVHAMRSGDHVLLDEISLADDSVLERLNSVLEPARTLVLAERATSSNRQTSDIGAAQIQGADGFQVLATMNPGGDYGKKELSPALRNRFTEIWVPHVDIRTDLIQIINAQWKDSSLSCWTEPIIDFADWFMHQVGGRDQSGLGLRDLLSWSAFINAVSAVSPPALPPALGFAHGASLSIIDGLGALPATAAMSKAGLEELRQRCLSKVASIIAPHEYDPQVPTLFEVSSTPTLFGVGPFNIPRGALASESESESASFSFGARTSASNAMRVLRALSVPSKSVLLEGSPGAGKTSLITALAKASGQPLTRINLSDQTELVDLFGSDMPLEGGGPGEFAWRDAAFLMAMQRGEWVLLDEMNLASQTVLEGLNSCLDHRGTVYVPELGRSFEKHPSFRIFAAQNPHHQGGGRKGLPKSFLNRFIKVHVEELAADDILAITGHLYSAFEPAKLQSMIRFNFELHRQTVMTHAFGRIGAPWEFNLRDLLRWLDLLHTDLGLNALGDPVEHLASLYLQRFRTETDRQKARELFQHAFGAEPLVEPRSLPTITPDHVRIGHAVLARNSNRQDPAHSRKLALLQRQLPCLETLIDCVHKQWLAILVGATGTGKTSMVRLLAQLAGSRLEEVQMNSGTDTMDLIGTFEQFDPLAKLRHDLSHLLQELEAAFDSNVLASTASVSSFVAARAFVLSQLERICGDTVQMPLDTDEMMQMLVSVAALPGVTDRSALLQAMQDLRMTLLQQTQSARSSEPASGRFEWVEGPLLRALREGHWLLLDNANLCSASVLDRLNSLFEPDGSLMISERGMVDGEVQVVRPHPNFRVFMCLDPRHGELSRAMRNRGIEIAVLDRSGPATDDAQRLRLLCGPAIPSAAYQSSDWTATRGHLSTQRQLMASVLGAQRTRRGRVEDGFAALSIPGAENAVSPPVSWALSQLALSSSLLASAVFSTFTASTARAAADLEGSFLIRASSLEALELMTRLSAVPHLVQLPASVCCLLTDGRTCLAGGAGHQTVDRVGRMPPDLMKRLSTDLRYDSNVLRIIPDASDVQALAKNADLLLRALVSGQELHSLASAARGKKAQHLSILERSSISGGQLPSPDEDQTVAAVRLIFPLCVALTQAVKAWSEQAVSEGMAMSVDTLRQLGMLLNYCLFLRQSCDSEDLDFSSIQILVRSIAGQLRELAQSGLSVDRDLSRFVDALGGSLQLTTGHGFEFIWSLFTGERGMHMNMSRLIVDQVMSHRQLSKKLVRNALGIAATLRISGVESCSAFQAQELLELGRQALQMVGHEARKAQHDDSGMDAAAAAADAPEAVLLNVMEATLRSASRLDSSQTQASRTFVQLLENTPNMAIQAAVVACKAGIWASETSSEAKLRLLMTDHTWIRRLWVDTGRRGEDRGPETLFQPIILHTLLCSREGNRSLRQQAQHDARRRRLVQTAGAVMPASSPGRTEKMLSILLDFVRLVSSSLLEGLQKHVTQTRASDLSDASFSQLAAIFRGISEQPSLPDGIAALATEWSSHLTDASMLQTHEHVDAMLMGQAWISLSLVLLRMYLPNVALDPIVSRQTHARFQDFCHQQLRASLQLEEMVELAITGHADNVLVKELKGLLKALQTNAANGQGSGQSQAWRKSDLRLLSQFYREAHSFMREVISPARMQDLVETIRYRFDSHAEQREESLQASMLSFGDRLRHTFAALRDIVEPMSAFLLQLQLGFRMLIQAARVSNSTEEVAQRSKIVEALVTFPTTRTTSALRELGSALPMKSKSRSSDVGPLLLVISAASVAFDRNKLGERGVYVPETLRHLSRYYEQIFHLWSLDRERAKRDEEEATSLYKSRKIEESIELDADAEEREFMALFPEYDGDVLDQVPKSSTNGNADEPTDSNKKATLSAAHHVAIWHTHVAAFGASSDEPKSRVFETLREELVQKLLRKHYGSWNEHLDQVGAAFALDAVIKDVLLSQTTAGDFNFYVDPRPAEIRKATVIVEELRDRLSELIRDWPEQMVLQHIRDRCDAVLRLNASSPVAKVLSALEQLLTHTEDWEGFASSETSIKQHRERISGQIIEWRRLELSCWAELLNAQARTFEEGVAEWWFRVYEILVHGTQSASIEGPNAFQTHLDKMIDAVDQFVRSSPIGQFEARLGLLETYARYLDLLVRLAPPKQSHGFGEVALILHNVTSFFRQFDQRISSTLASQRSVLEKDIASFIKLASWKDLNVHALKQSAQKTHRQLHKTIRKFRDILRQPVDPILAAHLDALSRRDMPAMSEHGFEHITANLDVQTWQLAVSSAEDTAPDHIRNLDKTLQVLQRMGSGKLLPSLLSPNTRLALSELADDIIEKQQQLAKLTPAFAKEDNEKAIKNLTARKRKAWSDLLKELRRIGLSSFLKTGVAESNQSVASVYVQPRLLLDDASSLQLDDVAGLDQLHFRLLATLPKVRNSLQGHSPDLSTAELQRGINYIEHVTSIVFQERRRIASQLEVLKTLDGIAQRLKVAHSASASPLVRIRGLDAINKASDFLARLTSALQEIGDKASAFIATSAFRHSSQSESVVAQIGTHRQELSRQARLVADIAARASIDGRLHLVTADEQQILLNAESEVHALEVCLADGEKQVWALESLLHPTKVWIRDQLQVFSAYRQSLTNEVAVPKEQISLAQQAEAVISSVLQIAQDLRGSAAASKSNGPAEDEADDLPDKAVMLDLQRLESHQAFLRSDSFLDALQLFLDTAQQTPRDNDAQVEQHVELQLARVYPFVHEYCELLRAHVASSTAFSSSLLKLDHILCNLMVALASKGFCKPPEEQQDDAGEGDDGEQLEGGTGLGDGSGAKDITDKMEDDDQIEELQKDDPLDEGEDGDKTEREKNAREADQDFGGAMDDVSVDGDEDGEGDDQDEEDDQAEKPEDAIGDVDPLDPNAVDEKIWDGDEEEEQEKDSKPEDKTDQDLGANGDNDQKADSAPKSGEQGTSDDKNESKELAGDNQDQESDEQRQQQQQTQEDQSTEGKDDGDAKDGEEQSPDEQDDENADQQEEAEQEEGDVDMQGEGGGRQIDQEANEGENLDLNDDINMEDLEGGSQGGDEDEDGLNDLSDIEQPPEENLEAQQRPEESNLDDQIDEAASKEELEKIADQDGDADEDPADEDQKLSKEEGEDAMDQDEEEAMEQGAQPESGAMQDSAKNQANANQADPFDIDAIDQGAEDGGQDESAQQRQSSRSKQGRRVGAQQEQSRADQGTADQDEAAEPEQPDTAEEVPGAGANGSRAQEQKTEDDADPSGNDEAEVEANPLRSMGDALQAFRRQMQEIQAAREDEEEILGEQAEKDGDGMPQDGDVEHVAHEENAEQQALGAAKDQDEVRNLGDLGIEDQDEASEGKPRGQDVKQEPMDEPMQEPRPIPDHPEEQHEKRDGQTKAFMPSDIKPATSSLTAEQEALIDRDGDANLANDDDGDEELVNGEDEEDMTPMPDDSRESADQEIQQQLAAFRSIEDGEDRLAKAGDLWRSYASLTADLAFALCEQLRLVLAPTLATRLNGDFRTGKRLNMRKIVPFIASDFAKDKIWLRRTKPSSREYQVLLAVDDSRSMSESRSAHLAYQTLALVTGALSRLEVGDVSICRFGEQVESLHDFGKGTFNEQNGAHVIDRLGFQQRGTNVLKLVEKSLDTLAEARAGRSSSSASQAADLWQLEIIISDGICQDHAKLRALLRRAAEQRVMLVFVVIDSLQAPPPSQPTSSANTPSASRQQTPQQQQQRSSILEMSNVSYYTDGNGKLQLKMERYMDTFPFDYYVVVRDVEALPEVLSATLRQWVEKIRETET